MEIRGLKEADAFATHAAMVGAMTFVGRSMLLSLVFSEMPSPCVTYKMGLDLQNGYRDGGFA